MINRMEWECLATENHLAQPLDAMLTERLAQALPERVRPAFMAGAELLCASLNRGDAYLPLDENEFAATVGNWLALPESGRLAGDVCGYLTGQLAAFKRGLDKNKFGAVVCGTERPDRPLVYDHERQRLYFERYFEAVKIINGALSGRIGPFPFELPKGGEAQMVADLLRATPEKMRPDPRQTGALLLALRNRTLLVSGGPGTGKTTVVLQILRLFLRAIPWLTADDVRIAAPTGRAAARLQESIAAGLASLLDVQEGTAAQRTRDGSLGTLRGTTAHRLLGFNPSTAAYARNRENPVDAAVVVVDEVSMLDLELFGRLLEALPEQCLLILLGDRFQLPPIGAGAVLGDLTAGFDRKKGDSLSKKTVSDVWNIIDSVAGSADRDMQDLDAAAATDTAHPLCDRAVILTRSHRSAQKIQEVAAAINGDENPMALLDPPLDLNNRPWETILGRVPDQGSVLWLECRPEEEVIPLLEGWLMHHFGPAYQELLRQELLTSDNKYAASAVKLLDEIEKSRILTVVREGRRGVTDINRECCRKLGRFFDRSGTPDRFHGMPIMVTRNAPGLGLYNGDCGVLLRNRDRGYSGLFRAGRECVVHPVGALPAWEPAFAMTVHKSQGSEYDRVLLVLPHAANPLCTREILYTALTRAKRLSAVIGDRLVLEHALGRVIARNTGIEMFSGLIAHPTPGSSP
jgi:exodeoxyribonuclease V alpha subunit